MLYGIINMCQHWLRCWLFAWWQPIIIWFNVDSLSVEPLGTIFGVRVYTVFKNFWLWPMSSKSFAYEFAIKTSKILHILHLPHTIDSLRWIFFISGKIITIMSVVLCLMTYDLYQYLQGHLVMTLQQTLLKYFTLFCVHSVTFLVHDGLYSYL